MTIAAVKFAAANVAEAQIGAERKAGEVAKAVTARDQVKSRIDALEAERSGIVATRKGGTNDPADGPRLALIAADLEGLRELLAPAEADLTAARRASEEAGRTVVATEAQLSLEADRAMIARLVAHASELDELFLATINDIASRSRNLGLGRPVWVPSPALALELHRLDLGRQNLGPLP